MLTIVQTIIGVLIQLTAKAALNTVPICWGAHLCGAYEVDLLWMRTGEHIQTHWPQSTVTNSVYNMTPLA